MRILYFLNKKKENKKEKKRKKEIHYFKQRYFVEKLKKFC